MTPRVKQWMVAQAGERTWEFRAMVEPALLMAGLAPDTRSMWLPYRADVYLRGGLRLRIGRLTQLGSKSDGWRVCVTEGARQSRPWAPSWVDDTDGSPAALVELLRAMLLTVAIRG